MLREMLYGVKEGADRKQSEAKEQRLAIVAIKPKTAGFNSGVRGQIKKNRIAIAVEKHQNIRNEHSYGQTGGYLQQVARIDQLKVSPNSQTVRHRQQASKTNPVFK